MFANGSLPYSDFFATGGFFYYLLVSLAFRLGSTLWLIPIQFLTYYLSGSYLYKTVMHMTNKKEIATLISIISMSLMEHLVLVVSTLSNLLCLLS